MVTEAEIKTRMAEWFAAARRAEAKREKDLKNFHVHTNIINEFEARASELMWVLQLHQSSSSPKPPLQQADVMRAQRAEPLPAKAYCSECGVAVNSSRERHYHWCSLAGNGA